MTASDKELWAQLAGADEMALTALFLRHSDAVYNFAFRRTASWSVADDVVQATFTALWRRGKAGRIDPLRADTALAVLLVMAGHECANHTRSARRHQALVTRIGRPGDEADHADAASNRVDDERRMSEVRRALERLPRNQREVVELVAWSHCSMREAAVALGVSEGAVKSRLFRARTRLTGLLDLPELATGDLS